MSDWRAKEAAKYAADLNNADRVYWDARDGAVYWKSVQRPVPRDVCEKALVADPQLPLDMVRQIAAIDAHNSAFLAEYRKNQANRSPEQVAEQRMMARAALGPGQELVNVATGERFRT